MYHVIIRFWIQKYCIQQDLFLIVKIYVLGYGERVLRSKEGLELWRSGK